MSTIIPVFNRQEAVSSAIASAAAELGEGDEIIVVDDASSPPITLPSLPGLRPALRLVRKAKNGGPASARNRGIMEAGKDLIAFLDSDDVWLPGKLAEQKRLLAASPQGLVAVACGWREMQADDIFRERLPRASRTESDFFAGCWFCPGSTLLLSRAAFERIGLFREDIRRLEDFEWFLRFARAGGRLAVADVIGASITRGANARPQPVEEAARRISDEFRSDAAVDRKARTDLLAYLDLERAGAYRNDGQYLKTAFYMTRSLLRRPRLRPALRKWWR